MTTNIKARYRNKLKKIIIEVWNGEKWIYVKTLSDPLIEFKEECLTKVSLNKPENNQIKDEKFAYYLLGEHDNKDTIEKIPAKNLVDNILKEFKPR